MHKPADTNQLSTAAQTAARKGDWRTVNACAQEILRRNDGDPMGYFLSGLVESAARRPERAIAAFSRTLQLDPER